MHWFGLLLIVCAFSGRKFAMCRMRIPSSWGKNSHRGSFAKGAKWLNIIFSIVSKRFIEWMLNCDVAMFERLLATCMGSATIRKHDDDGELYIVPSKMWVLSFILSPIGKLDSISSHFDNFFIGPVVILKAAFWVFATSTTGVRFDIF